MVLDEEVYAQVRQAVVEKLGNNAKGFIAGLTLKTT